MKAVAFGAVGQPEQEIVDLQYQLIDSLRNASPDDKHVSFHLSTLLSRVFPAIPPASSNTTMPQPKPSDATTTTGDDAETDEIVNPFATMNNAFSALPWLGFDMPDSLGQMENNPLDWDTGIVSGFGYDPSSIVSDIEQMLAATNQGQMGGGMQFSGL